MIVITRGSAVTLPRPSAQMIIKNQKGFEESFNTLQPTAARVLPFTFLDFIKIWLQSNPRFRRLWLSSCR